MKKFNKKGFTIVELVIVIAVIGILAGVLIPTFSGITKRANETAAMQEATSGRNAILALTGGQMPENTMFYILDYNTDGTSTAEYAFKYKDGAMETQESATATPEQYNDDATKGYYVCYFSADEKNGLTTDGSSYAKIIAGYVIEDPTNVNVSTDNTDGNYYIITVTKTTGEGEAASTTTKVIHAYFSGDLNNSLIIFLGNAI